MVLNGGMEDFTGDIPDDWTTTTPTLVSQTTAAGTVHSGSSAVVLEDTATLTQTIDDITEGCFYQFSFFANAQGGLVGITATVNFVTDGGDVLAASIEIRQGDLVTSSNGFAFFTVYTIEAPAGVTGARIDFLVTADGEQSATIDDVSFGGQ